MRTSVRCGLATGIVVLCLAASAPALLVPLGHYGLGEAGTLGSGAGSFFVPLIDDVGVANNITTFQITSDGAVGVVTTGLAAPGSTAALQTANNYWWDGNGWYGGAAYGLTDNWAFDLWIRPDEGGGTYSFATDNLRPDNSSHGLLLHYQFDGHLFLRQASSGLAQDGGTYTVGTWQRVTDILSNGTSYFYVNGILKSTAPADVSTLTLDSPMLGFGPGGLYNTNAAYDEFRVWSFGANDPEQQIANSIGVPEPSTLLAFLAVGGLGLAGTRRRRA